MLVQMSKNRYFSLEAWHYKGDVKFSNNADNDADANDDDDDDINTMNNMQKRAKIQPLPSTN